MSFDKKLNSYILRTVKKIKIVNHFGGKCSKCGESRFWCLSFHHKHDKKDAVSRIERFSSKIKEANKCVLLCENCHRQSHEKNSLQFTKYKNAKIVFLEYKRQKYCSVCLYDKSISALEFHHIDPKLKEFELGRKTFNVKTVDDIPIGISKELDKCSVLCSNCHRDLHFDHNIFNTHRKTILEKIECFVEKSRKVDRELISRLKESGLSNAEISRKLKCSKSTVTYALKQK